MVDDLSANPTSRFKLFWFRVVRSFQSCLLCNFQLLLFEYELRVIWDILGSIGIYFHGVSAQEVREIADRSRHSSQTIGPTNAYPAEPAPIGRHLQPNDRTQESISAQGSADRSPLVADRSPSLPTAHIASPIDRQATQFSVTSYFYAFSSNL